MLTYIANVNGKRIDLFTKRSQLYHNWTKKEKELTFYDYDMVSSKKSNRSLGALNTDKGFEKYSEKRQI